MEPCPPLLAKAMSALVRRCEFSRHLPTLFMRVFVMTMNAIQPKMDVTLETGKQRRHTSICHKLAVPFR